MRSKIRVYTFSALVFTALGSMSFFGGRELAAGFGLDFSGGGEPANGYLTSDPAQADDPRAVAPRGNWSIEEAKNFTDFPVFWAGEEFAGVPLEAIVRANYLSAVRPEFTLVENSVSFLYGRCVPPESGEGGCPNPYQVTVQPACMLPRNFVERSQIESETTVRGVPAEVFFDGHIVLWTQEVAITIFAPDNKETLAIIDKIVPLNASGRVLGDEFTSAVPTDELNCEDGSPAKGVVTPGLG